MPFPTPLTVTVYEPGAAADGVCTTTLTFCDVPVASTLLDGKKLQVAPAMTGAMVQEKATFTSKPTCELWSVKLVALLGFPGAALIGLGAGVVIEKSPTFITTGSKWVTAGGPGDAT